MSETLTRQQSKMWPPAPLTQERNWPPPQGEWRYEDYLRLPEDGYRYEVIEGVLVMTAAPKPAHQIMSRNLAFLLFSFVAKHKLGEVIYAPVDVLIGDLATPVQPDILFVARERLDIIRESYVEGAPDLIVEILSPTNWVIDRRDKFAVYEAAGVREYWIVDPDAKTVEVYSLRQSRYALVERYEPGQTVRSELLTGFEMPVDALYE